VRRKKKKTAHAAGKNGELIKVLVGTEIIIRTTNVKKIIRARHEAANFFNTKRVPVWGNTLEEL